MNEDEKLLPCPFCGGKAAFNSCEDADSENAGGEWIYCIGCEASTNICFPLMESVREKLAEQWNRRAAVVVPAASVSGPASEELLIEQFRAALLLTHSQDWTMEEISEAAHICARVLRSLGQQQASEAGYIESADSHCGEVRWKEALPVSKIPAKDSPVYLAPPPIGVAASAVRLPSDLRERISNALQYSQPGLPATIDAIESLINNLTIQEPGQVDTAGEWTAWLIERGPNENHIPHVWLICGHEEKWTPDPNKATKFYAREAAVDYVEQRHGGMNWTHAITEHSWIDNARAPAQVGQQPVINVPYDGGLREIPTPQPGHKLIAREPQEPVAWLGDDGSADQHKFIYERTGMRHYPLVQLVEPGPTPQSTCPHRNFYPHCRQPKCIEEMARSEEAAYCPHGFLTGCPICIGDAAPGGGEK